MLKRKTPMIMLLICLMIFSSFTTVAYGIDGFTSQPVYHGMEKGQTHYQNIRFTDITNHWAKEAIQEIAALSLMKGDRNRFSPNGNLTYLEALTVLVRAVGGEAAAQQAGEAEIPTTVQGVLIMSAVDNWARGYIQVALERGIITENEVNAIMNISPAQATALEEQIARRMEAFQGQGYSTEALNALQTQIKEQLEQQTIWNKPVSRQEVALWIARVLKLTPQYGDQLVRVYRFNDWKQMDTEKIPYLEAILQEGIMSGTNSNTFSPKGSLTRGQMAQILYNIHDRLLEARGYRKLAGTILSEETVSQQGKDRIVYALQNDDKTMSYLSVEPSTGSNFVVQRDGQQGLAALLKPKDYIEYYLNEQEEVVYAKVLPNIVTTIEGTVELVDVEHGRLAILDYDNQRHLYQLDSSIPVKVNGKDALLKDLLYGQEVEVSLRFNRIIAVDAFLEEDPNLHGYIPPGSREKVGDVLSVTQGEIQLKVTGNTEKYRILEDTRVYRNGRSASLNEMKVGDRVILSFNDIYSADVSEIRIEDDERHIEGVYRGTLEQVNVRGNEIILNNVTQYVQGAWTRHPEQKVKLKVEGSLYRGGDLLTLDQLSSEVGNEVYAAVENSYGVNRAAKVLVKNGTTQQFDSKISNLQYGTGRMTVNNNYVNFSAGTIVISNNRLVDRLNLEQGQTVHVVSDYRNGVRNAAFVAIQYDGVLDDRVDGTKLLVYRGRIESLGEYRLTLSRLTSQSSFLKLKDNVWVSDQRSKTFSLTEDTYIFDSELKQEIEAGYLINSRFFNPNLIKDATLRNRVKNKYYIGKNVFLVVKETTVGNETVEEILGINLTPNLAQKNNFEQMTHTAMAEVKSVDVEGEGLVLTNIRNWNSLSKRWEAPTGEEAISLEKAVILLNDQPIDRESLYLIKPRAKAYLVKHKSVSTQDDAYIVILEQ